MASMLVIPDRFGEEAGAPPVLLAAGAPDCAGRPLLLPPFNIPLTLDKATPRRAATFSTGHAPCIFACTAASPARPFRAWASVKLVSADCNKVWIWVWRAPIWTGRGPVVGSALGRGAGRRGDPAAASAGERVALFPPACIALGSSTTSREGAMVLTEDNVLRCCIMS